MGKVEGDAEECHFDNSSFISKLVCFFLVSSALSFFVVVVLSLFVRRLLLLHFLGTTSIWMEYCITLPVYVCVCLFT